MAVKECKFNGEKGFVVNFKKEGIHCVLCNAFSMPINSFGNRLRISSIATLMASCVIPTYKGVSFGCLPAIKSVNCSLKGLIKRRKLYSLRRLN